MIRGRKCRENTNVILCTDDVVSPKRKDVKLSSINTNMKTEMASTKKTECKKSCQTKRDITLMDTTSHTITDFFQQKSVVCNVDPSFKNTLLLDTNKSSEQCSPSKPVTPHRIVCLSPEKKNSEFLETSDFHDNKRPVRNKKRLDMTSSENSNKQVLNSSANPTARQNTKNNKKSIKEEDANKKLTDFFPIRRSVRKTNKEVQQELLRSYETAILRQSEDGLEVKSFENKGRGVITLRPFRKNEFVLEYIGELISMGEANKREVKYAKDENTGCYMYYFKYSEQQFCIDATEETGKLGRLVNHSRNGNLVAKTVAVKGQPHLILVAKYDIKPGVELTYDYGDRSKESLTHHPWLAY